MHFSQVPPYALIHATEKAHIARAMPGLLYGRPIACRIYRAEVISSRPLVIERPEGFNLAGHVGRDEEKRIHTQAVESGYDSIRIMREDGVVFELVALPGSEIIYLSEMAPPCYPAKLAGFKAGMPLYCEQAVWPRLLPNALRSLGVTRLVDPATGEYLEVSPGPFDPSLLPNYARR